MALHRSKLIITYSSRTCQIGKITILIVYVVDIILTRNDLEEMERLTSVMGREFEIKDLKPLRYFLGMEVARSRKGIVVSKRKYILDLLKEIGVRSCKLADRPMDQNKKIGTYNNGTPMDQGRYQRLMGKLIYLTHSTKYCLCSEHCKLIHARPREEQLEVVFFQILRYLKLTSRKGLFFRKSKERKLEVTDVD